MPEPLPPMQATLRSALQQTLVPQFYQAATYVAVVPGTYDPLTSTLSAATVTELPLTVRSAAYAQQELVPDVILPTDRKLIVQQAQYPDAPSIQHDIRVDDVLYSIVSVREEAPGITWTVQGRKKGHTP